MARDWDSVGKGRLQLECESDLWFDCRLGFQKDRQLSVVPSKGLRCPVLHPQSFAEGKDPGVTFLPHSHKHSAYRLFQVIRRIKTHPNPELLCSKSIYNFFSPLPGGKSGLQVGKLWGGRDAPVQQPVASLLAFVSWECWDAFLETAASHPSGRVALSALTLGAQAVRKMGLCSWRKSPQQKKTTPGISKWFDPGLATKKEGRGASSSFKNLEATALLPRKGGKKQVFPH